MPATLGTAGPPWLPAALDAAPVAMMVVNADGRILLTNAHAERAFGYSRSELEAMEVEALLTVEGQAPWRMALASILSASGTPSPLPPSELVGVSKSGTTFPIELALGHMGAPYEAMAAVVVRDIGEQRRESARQEAASAEAREARERLEALLQVAPAFIIAVSNSGTIDFINRVLPQHSREDVIGSDWLLYFPPERKALMAAELKASLETGATRSFETVSPGPDGADIWFESHLAPIHVGGQISGVVLAQGLAARYSTTSWQGLDDPLIGHIEHVGPVLVHPMQFRCGWRPVRCEIAGQVRSPVRRPRRQGPRRTPRLAMARLPGRPLLREILGQEVDQGAHLG